MSEPMNDMSLGVIGEVGKKVFVYMIYIEAMSGKLQHNIVYTSKYVAQQEAENFKEEFVTTRVKGPLQAEVITGERCIFGKKVYALDRTTETNKVRQQALAKLNEKEKKVLGIK